MILSYFYGVSNVTDAYLISLTIPVTIFSFIGTGIVTSYIPMYSSIVKEKGVKLANDFTNNIINFILISCTIIILIVWNFTVPIVKVFASGFDEETLRLTVGFTRISILGIYFSGLIYIFLGFLQIKNNYFVPAIMVIPHSILTMISIVFSKYNIAILPIGSVIAILGQLLFLIPFLRKKGYRYRFVLKMKDENLKKMIYLSIPVIIGVSVNQNQWLVDNL